MWCVIVESFADLPESYKMCGEKIQTNISKFLDDVNNGITVQEFIYDEEGFKFFLVN